MILIAVALFAALSYAITQSGRGSGNITREKDMLAANALNDIVLQLNSSVDRMKLLGTPYVNMQWFQGGSCGSTFQLCNSGTNCVFAKDGGGMTMPMPNMEAFDLSRTLTGMALPGQPSTLWKTNIWLECDADMFDWPAGTSAPDRGLYFINVKKSVCKAFNKIQGIDGIMNEDLSWTLMQQYMTGCSYVTSGPSTGSYMIYSMVVIN